MSALSRRRFTVVAALWLAACSTAPRAPEGRPEPAAAPLRHTPPSRATATDPQGFYHQPAGLCDDYPEETTTKEKIRRDFATITETGAEVYRFAFGWDAIEPEPGRYDFLFWDEVVDTADRLGVTLIPYVCYTPAWAAIAEKDSYRQPPRDPETFGRFMEVIVNRYKGKIRSWELWNEPDLEAYWLGDAARFARLVDAGAKGVRRADPSAIVVLGGMARGRGPFFDELVNRRAIDAFDVINVHGYYETWDAARAWRYPERIDAMASVLHGQSLWMAEFGYSSYRYTERLVSPWGIEAAYAYEHTPEYQAVALIEHHVMALIPEKLSLTAWYRINDLTPSTGVIGDDNNKHLGILDVEGKPKPAFYALRLYNHLLRQPVRVADARSRVDKKPGSDAEVHVIERKDGSAVVFGWLRLPPPSEVPDKSGKAADTRRETVTITLPDKGYVKMVTYDARGDVTTSSARYGDGVISAVPLTGDQIFIAELLL